MERERKMSEIMTTEKYIENLNAKTKTLIEKKGINLLPQLEKRVKQPEVRVIVWKGDQYREECKAKIVDGHFLIFKTSDNVKQLRFIDTHPTIARTNRFFKKYTLEFYTGYFDEITKNPNQLEYDLPHLEALGKLYETIVDTDLAKKIAEEIKGSKMLREYIPWILFFLSNLIWMIFVTMLLDKVSPY